MRLLHSAVLCLFSLGSAALAASAWTFEDASLTIHGKSSGVGGGVNEKLSPTSPLKNAVTLSAADTLKIVLTTTEGKTGKRPHQAFLTLEDQTTGLQESFPFSIKTNGKGKVEVMQKDLPFQLATSVKPLKASIILASFGSSTPFNQHSFDLNLEPDTSAPPAVPSPPERYGSKPEIHHIFKADPKSPPQIVSLVFTLAVVAMLPVLFGAWLMLGANIEHMGTAFGASPIAHGLFLGSIVAMEGVFFLYYTSWNLFQTLPVAAGVCVVAYVSGSRALTEVQERRFSGER